jgi:hypothetical protein
VAPGLFAPGYSQNRTTTIELYADHASQQQNRTTTLFGPNDSTKSILTLGSTRSSDPQVGNLLAQLARLRITRNNRNISRRLVSNRDKVARLVDIKRARVRAVRRRHLSERQRAIGGNGVLRHGVVAVELLVVTVARVEELPLCLDGGDLCAGGRGRVVGVGRQCVLQRQADAVVRVRHCPAGHGVCELVRDEERAACCGAAGARRAALGGPEDAVAGTGAGGLLSGAALGELAGRLVDLVDADQVCAEVRHDDEVARRVDEDLMRVRGFLAVGVGAGSVHGVFQRLEGLSASERQLVGCNLGRAAVVWLVHDISRAMKVSLLVGSSNEALAVRSAIQCRGDCAQGS